MTILRSEGSGETSTGFFSHTLDQSLRFDDGSSPSLTRTVGSAGNRRTFTWSGWVKRSATGNRYNVLFSAKDSVLGNYFWIMFTSTADDQINVYNYPASDNFELKTNRLFRDVSGWYHIVLAVDTTQSTASNRAKLYVNGEQITDLATANYPDEDYETAVSKTNKHSIGSYDGSSYFFDGYMAEVNFIDGTALDPSSFGETKDGVWIPKNYGGSYGDEGFHLTFEGTGTATTSQDSTAQTNIGDDQSGNGNNFAIGSSSIVSTDVVQDSPTNSFSTMNSLVTAGNAQSLFTFSEGNLKVRNAASNYSQAIATHGVTTGKYYYECYITEAGYPSWMIGLLVADMNGLKNVEFPTMAGAPSSEQASFTGLGYFTSSNLYISDWGDTSVGLNTQEVAYSGAHSAGDAPTTGDIIGVAADFDNRKIYFHINGEYINVGAGTGNPSTGANPSTTYTASEAPDANHKFPWLVAYGTASFVFNFGQDDSFAGNKTSGTAAASDSEGIGEFYYSVPTGFKAFCASNLPDITIGPEKDEQADDNFNTVLYSGNSGTNAITGLGFQPDLVWVKSRSTGYNHELYDSVRGVNKRIYSDSTSAQGTGGSLSAFGSDGFTHTSGSIGGNASGHTYVGWGWKAGGNANTFNIDGTGYASMSAAPISDGTQALTGLSANTTSKFSIATFTMPDAERTVAHGLGVKPDWIIFKNLGTGSWQIWHNSFGEDTENVILFSTAGTAQAGGSGNWFQSLSNTLVGLGSYGSYFGTGDYVMYSFANVEGYSRIGSYKGNGAGDGTYVVTGFRPSFVLLKKSSASGDNWSMYDNKRDIDNPVREYLIPNDAQQAGSTDSIDFLSNGFKVRNAGAYINTSGATYIYLAFAEAPFKFANAR